MWKMKFLQVVMTFPVAQLNSERQSTDSPQLASISHFLRAEQREFKREVTLGNGTI